MSENKNITEDKGKRKKDISAIVIFFSIAIVSYFFGPTIYHYIAYKTTPSNIEWNKYSFNSGEENRVITNNESMLIYSNHNDPTASFMAHNSKLSSMPPTNSLESFCNSKDCYDQKNGEEKINNLSITYASAKFIEGNKEYVIEFIHLPDSRIEITIDSPIEYYSQMREIVNSVNKAH